MRMKREAMTDAGPIRTGELPKGWVSAGDGFEFEHPAAGLTVCADRRPGDADAEMAGAPGPWRVWYERWVGEATERRTVGCVTTRDAAVNGLLACMRRVSDSPATHADGGGSAASRAAASDDCRWISLSTLADGVSLRDAVPMGADGGTPVDETAYARSWAEKLDAEG